MTRSRVLTARLVVAGTLGAAIFASGAAAASGPGGTLVVLNKNEASASLIDRVSGEEVARLETGNGPHEVAVSPDGKTAVVCDYGQSDGRTLTVLDLTTSSISKTIDLGAASGPHGIVYEPDGVHVLVTAERRGLLLRVDVDAGTVSGKFETDQQASHMVVATPDASRAFVSNIASGSVSVIDLPAGTLAGVIKTGAGAEGIDITPDGREVWVGNRAEDTVTVIDAETLEVLEQIECAGFPIRVKATPDGSRVLVSCATSADVAVFDRESREQVARVSMADKPVAGGDRSGGNVFTQGPVPIGILIPPDGTQAFVANTNADMVTVIDLETLEITGRVRAGKTPDGMAWSPVETRAEDDGI